MKIDTTNKLVLRLLEACDEQTDEGATNIDLMAGLTIALAHVLAVSKPRDGTDPVKCASTALDKAYRDMVAQ